MRGSRRGRLPAVVSVLVAAGVGFVLLAPVHPEAGLLHFLASVLPNGVLAGGSPGWWAFEDLGNIALFVPVGAVAAWLLRPAPALAVGIAISVCCETAQLVIPERHASVQDVVMNTIGVVIGIGVTRGLLRLRRQASTTNPHSVQTQ